MAERGRQQLASAKMKKLGLGRGSGFPKVEELIWG